MIHLEKKHLTILLSILKQADVPFYAFGSRVTGNHKKFSDLDLCYKDKIGSRILNKIEANLIESELPFKVEIIDYNECSEEFKKAIDEDLTKLPEL